MDVRIFCNVVYAWLVREADQDGRKEIDGQLYAAADGSNDIDVLLTNVFGEDDPQ